MIRNMLRVRDEDYNICHLQKDDCDTDNTRVELPLLIRNSRILS